MSALTREITLTRLYAAPRELVFKMWTDPQHLKRWWGPSMFTNPVCEVDLRPGGKWRIVMRSPDGTDYPGAGIYREIVPPERLVFTNNAEDAQGNILLAGETTVTFENGAEGKTELTLHTRATVVDPIAASYIQGMEAGWSQSLDSLAKEIAASEPDSTDKTACS